MEIISIMILNMFLFMVLLALKLFVWVGIPWLWVTSPLWLPTAVLTGLLIISVIVEIIIKIFKL